MPLAITDSALRARLRSGADAFWAEIVAEAALCTESIFLSGGGVFFDAGLRLAAAFFAAGLLLIAAFFRTVFFPATAFFDGFFCGVESLRAAVFFARGFFCTDTRVVFPFLERAFLGLTRDWADLDGRLAALLFLDRFFMGCWECVEKSVVPDEAVGQQRLKFGDDRVIHLHVGAADTQKFQLFAGCEMRDSLMSHKRAGGEVEIAERL
jgi:hypothetical protein